MATVRPGAPIEPCEAATSPIPTPAPMPTVAAITNGIIREIGRTPTPLLSPVRDFTPCQLAIRVGTELNVWGDLP